jgi:taurine dioxygenase
MSRVDALDDFKHIEVRPLSGAIGAQIYGLDLSCHIPDAQFAEIRHAFHHYGVIFFRNQKLTPEQHIAFARRWGGININRFFPAVAGYPMVAEVLKEPHHKNNIGGSWHTDHSYDEIPAMGSILYALETPALSGDTLFASMYAAYDALSDGLKQMLGSLRAVHSSRHVFGYGALGDSDIRDRLGNPENAVQDAVHPVVIKHPDSGRAALYVYPEFTLRFDRWSAEESKPLLDYLYAHATRPEFSCRFRWQKGSVAFWDNRATWHRALNDYPGERRLMHRITVEGARLQQRDIQSS